MRARSRAGFTLIELVVALLVVGIVVSLTHQVFAVVVEGARTLEASRTALDRGANARRWMQAAWLSLEVGGEAGAFEGHRGSAEFTTWTMTPGGWFESARIRLELTDSQWVARSRGRALLLAEPIDAVEFDYLLTPGEASQWVHEWVSPASAPLAVRIRVRRAACRGQCTDTLLFLIGPRG